MRGANPWKSQSPSNLKGYEVPHVFPSFPCTCNIVTSLHRTLHVIGDLHDVLIVAFPITVALMLNVYSVPLLETVICGAAHLPVLDTCSPPAKCPLLSPTSGGVTRIGHILLPTHPGKEVGPVHMYRVNVSICTRSPSSLSPSPDAWEHIGAQTQT